MPHWLKLILAAVLGALLGSAVNMGLIVLGGALVPPPAGTDTATMEGLQAALPLFGPRHYLFPFLAHALGTLVGTFAATWAVGGRSWGPAAVVTALFLTGGTINAFLLPAPAWFIGADLLLAYLPMGWLGWQWGRRAGGTSAGTA